MKNKKESLIIILSCIFAVGLSAFLYFVVFNNEKSTLSSNNDYQEIKLGDACSSWGDPISTTASASTQGCSSSSPEQGGSNTSYCQYIETDDPDECYRLSGGTIVSDSCYIIKRYQRTCSTTLRDAMEGECTNPTYNGGTNTLEIATSGTNVTATGRYQLHPGQYDVVYTANSGHAFSDGTTQKTIKCSMKKNASATTGSCAENLVDDGESKTLASGGNHVTYQNNTATLAGEYQVIVRADDYYTFSDGTTHKVLNCAISSSESKCFCDSSNKNNCSWMNAANASFPIKVDLSEDECNKYAIRTCCYKDDKDNKYKVGNVQTQYCHEPVTTDTNVCETYNNSSASAINCLNPTYTGDEQPIADCIKCTITENGTGTDAKSYEVRAAYPGDMLSHLSKTCYIYRQRTAVLSKCSEIILSDGSVISNRKGYVNYSLVEVDSTGRYTINAKADSNHAFTDGTVEKTIYCATDSTSGSVSAVEGDGIIAIAADVQTVDGSYKAKASNGNLVSVNWNANGSGATHECVFGTNCTVTFKHQGANSCGAKHTNATVIAKDKNNHEETKKVDVYSYCAWQLKKASEGPYDAKKGNTRDEMKYIVGCNAYENWKQDATTKKWYGDHYDRCCGCGSSSNPPADYACYVKGDDYQWETSAPAGYTKVEGISEKGRCIPACYSNGTEYEWTNNPKTGYTQVTKITTSDLCKKEEEACYLYNGNYFWGKYQNTVGYEKQTAIKEEKYCNNPTTNPEAACYKNNATNDYVWTDNAPSGYTKVVDITSPNACSLPEVPACYLYNNQYVWGTHGKETGYSFISSVLDEDNCKKPASACYMGNSGIFVWGDYSLDVNYTLIDDSFCKPIDVPKTDLDTAKIIYIGMIVLLVSGIGFIYYVNYNKKKND